MMQPIPASTRDELDAIKGLLASVIERVGGNNVYASARALSDPDLIREQAAWFRDLLKPQPPLENAPDTED